MRTIRKFKTAKTNFFSICCAAAILMTYGCSKDNPLGDPLNALAGCGNGTWTEEVLDELDDYGVALSNYSSDPSETNCNALNGAVTNYYNALENVKQCVGAANQAAFNEALAEAKKEAEESDCDD